MKWLFSVVSLLLLSSCLSQKRAPNSPIENTRTERYREKVDAEGLQLADVPKVIYTFWNGGEDKMPPMYQDFVSHMRNQLDGKGWEVKVVNLIPGDPNFMFNILDSSDLPEEFNSIEKINALIDSKKLNPVIVSDLARLAILKKNGGVHLDPSVIMGGGFEGWIDRFNKSNKEITGFYQGHYADGDRFGKADGMENWGFAIKKNSEAAAEWYKNFTEFLVKDQINGKTAVNGEVYKNKELQKNIKKLGGMSEYLSQHGALKKTLIDSEGGKNFASRFLVEDSYQSDGRLNPLSLNYDVDWDEEKLIKKLFNFNEGDVRKYSQAPFIKFNSGQTVKMRKEIFLSKGDAYDAQTLFGRVMRKNVSAERIAQVDANLQARKIAQPDTVQVRGKKVIKKGKFSKLPSKKFLKPVAVGAAAGIVAGAIGAAAMHHFMQKNQSQASP